MCEIIAMILLACVGGNVPDLNKTIDVPSRCARKLSAPMRAVAPVCAETHGISYRIGGGKRKRRH